MKAGLLVKLRDDHFKVGELPERDAVVTFAGMKLRVVCSDDPDSGEPWYFLTSDMASTRRKIIWIYYYRLEIEEGCKGVKHIRDLHKLQVNLALSLKVVLWFVILGIALLHLCGVRVLGKRHFARPTGHPKKRLSWYRWLYELVEWLIWQPLHGAVLREA